MGQTRKTTAARPSATAPTFFASAPGFRAWLAKNTDDASFLNVGFCKVEQRIERKSRLYSYEQHRTTQLTEPEVRRSRRNKAAWAWFERLAPSRRRAMLHWIASAKRPDTRARRLDKLIESSASGVGLMP